MNWFPLIFAALYAWMAYELWPREKPATAMCAVSACFFLLLGSSP